MFFCAAPALVSRNSNYSKCPYYLEQFCLGKEGGDQLGPAFAAMDAFEGLACGMAKFPDVFRAEVREFGFLPVGPEILDGIEFGRVGGEPFHVQPVGLRLEIGADDMAAVNGRTVPQQQDFARHLAVQCVEKADDLRALDRALVQLEGEVSRRQSGDGREAFPIEVEGQNGRLTAGRPRARPARPLAQSAFVAEDEGAPFAPGFFLGGASPAFSTP
jgi:hypothetical protein